MNKSKVYFIIFSFLSVYFSCQENTEEQPDVIPSLILSNETVIEGDNEFLELSIAIRLSEATNSSVSLDLSTEDGSAKAGVDYKSISNQTITFNPNETNQVLNISIVGDNNLELAEYFNVKISNVNGATSPSQSFSIFITDDDDYVADRVEDGFITPDSYPSMDLVWADEFEGPNLNPDDWNYEIGNGCDRDLCGWGNNELQLYTDSEDNVFINDGKLVIRATDKNRLYESGRLTTQDKQTFKYGRIDFRAKLPEGQGIWPALWMLGANITEVGWPQCGEIDIMEMVGHLPETVHGTTHYDSGGYKTNTGKTSITSTQSFTAEFHVFTILWQLNKIEWLVDYNKYFTFTSTEAGGGYPFNNDFFMIMNVAVGGNWPGNPDESTEFPQEMVIDYVRVFQ